MPQTPHTEAEIEHLNNDTIDIVEKEYFSRLNLEIDLNLFNILGVLWNDMNPQTIYST